MKQFEAAERICRVKDPLCSTPEKRESFIGACREMAVFHSSKCREMGQIYRKYGFDPETIRTEEDIERIPVVGVSAMKYHLLLSMPEEAAALKLTSSGTKGQKTRVWFDKESLDRVQAMLETLWVQEGLVSKIPANYLMFVYDPGDAKDLGIAFTVKNQQRFAPPKDTFYAIKLDAKGEWEFRKELLKEKIKEYIKEGAPVRLSGIPSFMFDFIEEIGKTGRVKLPKDSYLLTGGGWKAAEDKKVSKEYFRSMVTDALGIPDENIRDGFGMAEHSAPYLECKKHKFHVPVYNRVITRDPETMKVLPPGHTGLLELVTPFNAMMPNLALLSTDLGFLDPESCLCGNNTPTFTLVGRGGLQKHKGCAIHAGEIVKRGN
ncbi:MAG: hypothetical protein NTX59_00725 [Elusimicrobia bacterium]|nr:hypothetical protein [Elusimicrobiota bacterium]